MRKVYFLTHPDVLIDPKIPVPLWSLSERGLQRMKKVLNESWIQDIDSIYCSTEKKAIDGAEIVADHLALHFEKIEKLGENDRSSTGFLNSDDFEETADLFFSNPDKSIRGWETATAAQKRITDCLTEILKKDSKKGDILIIAHGGVGTLLLCSIKQSNISRKEDQPSTNGGNYFLYNTDPRELIHGWKTII